MCDLPDWGPDHHPYLPHLLPGHALRLPMSLEQDHGLHKLDSHRPQTVVVRVEQLQDDLLNYTHDFPGGIHPLRDRLGLCQEPQGAPGQGGQSQDQVRVRSRRSRVRSKRSEEGAGGPPV